MKSRERVLIKNTIFLYILQFSTYFFSLIVVPYQTRIMGPSYYGKIGLANALMIYFQLFLDFGFLLSATAEIAKERNNLDKVSRIFTAVTMIKMVLSVIAVISLITICMLTDQYRSDFWFYFVYLLGTIVYAFIPDYLYRGLEKMESVTIRTVLIKLFFTLMIFVCLKKPEDYFWVPILNLIGNLVALIGVMIHLKICMKISIKRVTKNEILQEFHQAKSFFLSRIVSTIYTATNTLIIGVIDSTKVLVGYYTSADKLVSTAKNAVSPISDSMYPYMINHRDFKLMKKLLCFFMPFIITGSIIAFVFAEQVCLILFGNQFIDAAPILRAFVPIMIVILPSYMLGFPTLSAMGLARHANISIYVGTAVHVFNIVLFVVTNHLTVLNLAISTSIAETCILLYRGVIVWKNRKSLKVSE